MKLRLLAAAGLLAASALTPTSASATVSHTERHCHFYDPLGIWDSGVRICATWGSHGAPLNQLASTDLYLRPRLHGKVRCDLMEPRAFTRVIITQRSETTSDHGSRSLPSGGCRYHARFWLGTTGKRAHVHLALHSRRDSAPDSNPRFGFDICRRGGC